MYRIKNFEKEKPTLFLVATPIGNLEDITLRALSVLKSVDFVYSEDTRRTLKLFNQYNIKTKLVSYYEHNQKQKNNEILLHLANNKNIAIVSDAGLPVISDPGFEIVRETIANKYPVVTVPGANAGLTALIASGIPPLPYTFIGFLDSKISSRKKQLHHIKKLEHTIIIYESIHRLKTTLKCILECIGDIEIVIARELTKIHEEYSFGTVSEMIEMPPQLKGEIVLVLKLKKIEHKVIVLDEINRLTALGVKPMDAINEVAKVNNLKKNDVYQIYHGL